MNPGFLSNILEIMGNQISQDIINRGDINYDDQILKMVDIIHEIMDIPKEAETEEDMYRERLGI